MTKYKVVCKTKTGVIWDFKTDDIKTAIDVLFDIGEQKWNGWLKIIKNQVWITIAKT